jgi:hypothetical protein
MGTRINNISSIKFGYIPTSTNKQRAILAQYSKKVGAKYAVRNLMIYCQFKHQSIDHIDLGKRYALKPHRIKNIYYKIARQIKEWKDESME